jgi:hypothetical protein
MALVFDYSNASKTELLDEIAARQCAGRRIKVNGNSTRELADALTADDADFRPHAPVNAATVAPTGGDDAKSVGGVIKSISRLWSGGGAAHAPVKATLLVPAEIGDAKPPVEGVAINTLARLWQGSGATPRTYLEYRCRVAVSGTDFFARYDLAKARYAELRQMGEAVAAVFRPDAQSIPSLLQLTINSLDVENAKRALAAIRENVTQQEIHRYGHALLQQLVDPRQAPAWKLEREFPGLREELTRDLLQPALGRVNAEIARIRPLEERRLREAAEQEALSCGFNPSKAKAPPISALVVRLEAFAQNLSQAVTLMKNGTGELGGYMNGRLWFWFAELMETVDPLREQYRAWDAAQARMAQAA